MQLLLLSGRLIIKKASGSFDLKALKLAEKKGFEPLIGFHLYTLSRRASSTTPALLRDYLFLNKMEGLIFQFRVAKIIL